MSDPLRQLSEAGVAVWLDDLSRDRLQTGNLADLIRDRSLVGITTNPTIFQKAISGSDLYNPQLATSPVRGVDVGEALRAITTKDVRDACDVLRPAYDASDGVDGRVSIEVDPRISRHRRQDDRRGPRAVVAGRPAEPVHQDPGHAGEPAGDQPGAGRGHQRQRHADLQPGALRRA